eukprot:412274-Rhodomonas_salina.1
MATPDHVQEYTTFGRKFSPVIVTVRPPRSNPMDGVMARTLTSRFETKSYGMALDMEEPSTLKESTVLPGWALDGVLQTSTPCSKKDAELEYRNSEFGTPKRHSKFELLMKFSPRTVTDPDSDDMAVLGTTERITGRGHTV